MEIPLDLDIVWISTNSTLHQAIPIPGVHISSARTYSKVEQHFITRVFDTHVLPELDLIGEWYYGHKQLETNLFVQSIIQSEIKCESPLVPDAFQLSFRQLSRSNTEYTLNWMGELDQKCVEKLDIVDTWDAKNDRKVSVEIAPTKGFHSKFHIHVEPSSQSLVLASIPRDFFVDPFEIGRIDFGARVFTLGAVDLEVPSNSPDAQRHFVVASNEDESYDVLTRLDVQIPFHLRYQPPQSNETHVTRTMPTPFLIHVVKKCSQPIIPLAMKQLVPKQCMEFKDLKKKN